MSEPDRTNSYPSADSQPTAPPPLIPWRHALTVTAGLITAALIGLLTGGEAGALAASAGFMIGLYSLMSQGYWNAGIVGAVVALAAAISLGFPGTISIIVGSLLLLGLFIGIGLSISLFLIEQLDQQRSYWIMLIFVGRALTPFQGFQASTLRYGGGAF